ncbi:MAG TPA: 2OG-Fe(II) oxygenase [Allosphingosinicella sp.]|jgi:prolyl 4-hydroxylase
MTYLAEIGKVVRERLLRVPGIYHVPARELDMFVVRNFLTPEECAGLIELIDVGRRPSGVLGAYPDPEFRTSESCDLWLGEPLVQSVEDKITALMGIDPRHGETIQGQRYEAGQQFKPHHDFFYTDQPYWQEMRRCGGQRTWTAMVFLNEPQRGGQTYFERAGVRITPHTGNLLTWNNMDSNGEPNAASLHQGTPVQAGVKYVITKWYRQWHWGPEKAAEAEADAGADA